MRNNDIINSSYTIGVGTKNMVLNTLGRLYVKVQDRYYEIDFRNQSTGSNSSLDIITINSANDIENLAYPGDDKLIISEDGKFWITKNNEFKLIEFNQEELTVKNLIINGQLTTNSKELVENLNAQYLNGYTSTDFAIKNRNENITGTWKFKNATISENITSPYGGLTLDFANNKITVCKLDVTCDATFPDGFFSEKDVGNYGGFKNRTYFGREFKIDSFKWIGEYQMDLTSILNLAYDTLYLENYIETDDNRTEIKLDAWYDVFLEINIETEEIVPVDIENNKTEANEKLEKMGIKNKTIDDYSLLWKNIGEVDYSDYFGDIYNVIISNFDYNEFGTILPGNDVILNVTGNRAKILEINEDGIIIKLQNEYSKIDVDTKVIQIPKNGITYIQSSGPDFSYLDVIDGDNTLKARIGNLEGLKKNEVKGTGVYLNDCFIEKTNISDCNIQTKYLSDVLFSSSVDGGKIGNRISWNKSGTVNIKPNINKVNASDISSTMIYTDNLTVIVSDHSLTSTLIPINVGYGTIVEIISEEEIEYNIMLIVHDTDGNKTELAGYYKDVNSKLLYVGTQEIWNIG